MKLELSHAALAELLQGTYSKSVDYFFIENLSSIEQAKAQDITFLFDSDFTTISKEQLLSCKASCIIATKPLIPDRLFLIVQNPLDALKTLITHTKKEWIFDTTFDPRWPHAFVSLNAHIDPSVIIEPGVIIKSKSNIDAHSIIKAHTYIDHAVEIGSHCIIGPHVTVHNQTIIGNHVQIDASTTIGTDGFGYRLGANGFVKIPHAGNVQIGDHVEIGSLVSIDRAVFDATIIEDGCKIDNHVYIAHNVIIKKNSLILGHVVIGGSTQIGSWCKVGAQTAIKDHVIIGDQVQIVGKSGIMTNIESHQTIAGFPATSFLQWKKQMVSLAQLPAFLTLERRKKKHDDSNI
jgi:UDP-3-O-[3-hydroxymyristoyl] glucosamine N-acyltransferase